MLAESNNNLPAAWFSLLQRDDLVRHLAQFQVWETSLPSENDADDLPAPPELRLSVAQALRNSAPWLSRPGVAELTAVIRRQSEDPDGELSFDWGQYRGFYRSCSEFADSMLGSFDSFCKGEDAERPFDQVGELHPDPLVLAPPTGSEPKPISPSFEHRPSILDREWVLWLLAILAAAAGIGSWLVTASVLAGVAAFLLTAAGASLGIFALEARRRR